MASVAGSGSAVTKSLDGFSTLKAMLVKSLFARQVDRSMLVQSAVRIDQLSSEDDAVRDIGY